MQGTTEIDNSQDVIDSRDVIARIDYLESDEDRNEAENAELVALKALAEEAEGYAADWTYGEALIRESHFEDYARELADDCGMVKGDETWPMNCIDWEKAADMLKQDYTSVEFDGVTYWIR